MNERRSWVVIGYVILAVMLAFVMWQQQKTTHELHEEVKARQAFDDRRAFEICLAANDTRKAIADAIRGAGEDLIAVSQAAQSDRVPPPSENDKARSQRFADAYRQRIENRVEPLKPRDCEMRPQNSAGPQR